MLQAADIGAHESIVAIIGQRGLTREVCAQVCVRRGYTVADDAAVNDASVSPDVVIIVEPHDDDWRTAASFGVPIVVMLDSALADDLAVDTLLAGADAVVTTFDDPSAVERALDIVLAGEVQLPRALARTVLARLRDTWRPAPAVELTQREREILDSIAKGDAVKQTARLLGITVKTVQNLQSRLFRKLGARNRTQAITRAHELGLLDSGR